MTLDVVTGELVPVTAARLSPAEAAEAATWLRDMLRSVLTEGEDYGTIPGTKKPTLFKAGAEMLVLASGMRFDQCRLDDEDAREHRGITYRCTVYRGEHAQAVCDGYAGYDEYNFAPPGKPRAGWNTIIKMAQKRALVGAALNAVAGSALLAADLDDPPADTGASSGNATMTQKKNWTPDKAAPLTPSAALDEPPAVDGLADVVAALNASDGPSQKTFRAWCKSEGLAFPPATSSAATAMLGELRVMAERAAEENDAYGGG